MGSVTGPASGVGQEGIDLGAFEASAWTLLKKGLEDRRHGFHYPTLATVDPQGEPRARIVVLRRVTDPGSQGKRSIIAAHTDLRSPKAEQLAARHSAAWVFYDPPCRVQVRLSGQTRIEHDTPLADEQWEEARLMSRRCYLAPGAPGSKVDHQDPNLPLVLTQRDPTLEESEAGRANFAVVVTEVSVMDVLRLRHDGHARARFEWDERGVMSHSGWVLP